MIVGFGINYLALGAFLAAAILTGQLMANTLSNSGGAWDNAKKYIEDGHEGGKGSDAHKAAVIGDTVGDPFKDTAGPALNPLIKVMNLVSLLILPAVITLRHNNGGPLRHRRRGPGHPARGHRLLQAQDRRAWTPDAAGRGRSAAGPSADRRPPTARAARLTGPPLLTRATAVAGSLASSMAPPDRSQSHRSQSPSARRTMRCTATVGCSHG